MVGRILVLIILLALAGSVIWASVTNQRIGLTETVAPGDINLKSPINVEGLTINVVRDGLGTQPVILLHDFDIAGGVLLEGLVGALGDKVTAIRIDLPGFGLSTRLPEPGPEHTVTSIAEVVSRIVDSRFGGRPVVFAGVGFGGEVASEVAVVHPDLVAGLVLIDTDFYQKDGWIETLERLPFFGTAVAYTMEGGGSYSFRRWAPNCTEGGWCPTQSQSAARDYAERIQGTTDSLAAFRNTPGASLVPARLDEIAIPTVFIWSKKGVVPEDSVNRALAALGSAELVEVDVWKAHLEAPDRVADAVLSVLP